MRAMNRIPLILAIALLLLPVLYVGSYLALLTPLRCAVFGQVGKIDFDNYRICPRECSYIFWPLEQIDRKVRPAKWTHGSRRQARQLRTGSG